MKKVIIKCIVFSLLFCLLWIHVQSVLEYKYEQQGHYDSKIRDYINEIDKIDDGLDVVLMGTSPIYKGVSPNVLWNEAGITSYNFGGEYRSSPLMYYTLKYLLKFKHPKVVVLELSDIFRDMSLDDDPEKFDTTYRSVIDAIKDNEIKDELIDWICTQYSTQKKITYYFPLLRYHSRWDDLSNVDFDKTVAYNKFNRWAKGAAFRTEQVAYDNTDNVPYEQDENPIASYLEYYKKIIELCQENEIDVVLTLVPKLMNREKDLLIVSQLERVFNVKVCSVVTKEEFADAKINIKTDYYDIGHLNILGQNKFSTYLAEYLVEHCSLQSHKDDQKYHHWQEYYEYYRKYYNDTIEKMITD